MLTFIEFIAIDQQRSLVEALEASKMSLDHHAELANHRVHMVSKFFSAQRSCSGDAKG